jgi:hypothetical protein
MNPKISKSQAPTQIVSKKSNKNKNKRRNKKNKLINGDERIEAPVSMGFQSKYSAPKMTNTAQITTICHREFISDISSSILFSVVKNLPINPGMSSTFPWLSQVAARFEKYRFKYLRFIYETDSSTFVAGSIMLVPDFDADDPAPISKSQALSYKSSVRTQLWEHCTCECAQIDLNAMKQYYIRTGNISQSVDIKTYDVGNMFVCSSGAETSNSCGELWVEYGVDLISPNVQINFNTINGPAWYHQATVFVGDGTDNLFGDQLSVANFSKSNGFDIS